MGFHPLLPNLFFATPGDGEVSWVRQMNMEVDVISYRIYSETSVNPTTLTDSTAGRNDTTKTIAGLTNETICCFRIPAVDTARNESDYSNRGQRHSYP